MILHYLKIAFRYLLKTALFESCITQPVEVPHAQPYFNALSGGGHHLFYGDEYVYCPFG